MAWRNRSSLGALAALALGFAATPTLAQKQYGPGVTDTEIKIGTTTPYSGPASAYSAGAVSATAYFTIDQRARRRERPQDQIHQP